MLAGSHLSQYTTYNVELAKDGIISEFCVRIFTDKVQVLTFHTSRFGPDLRAVLTTDSTHDITITSLRTSKWLIRI
jgi:hypothetical protein